MYTELKEDHAEQSRIVQLALQSTLILEPAGTAFAFSDVGEGPNVPTVLGFPKSSLGASGWAKEAAPPAPPPAYYTASNQPADLPSAQNRVQMAP